VHLKSYSNEKNEMDRNYWCFTCYCNYNHIEIDKSECRFHDTFPAPFFGDDFD
jgi:hypothetical protein